MRYARASRAAVADLSFARSATLLNWIFLGARISGVQLAGFVRLWIAIFSLDRACERAVVNIQKHAESEHPTGLGVS